MTSLATTPERPASVTLPTPGDPAARVGAFALWLLIAGVGAWTHVPWRDEVRALSIALQGENLVAMLRALHGEGHPALWYVGLRVLHDLVGSPLVLPALGLAFTAGAAALVAFASPFPVRMVALLLSGHAFVFEYAVVSRNYGAGAMFLLALAAVYPRFRDRGLVLGGLLALAANCSLPAAIAAGAFTMFWFGDLLERDGVGWTPALRNWALNAALAALGALAAAATIYPTYNDAAFRAPQGSLGGLLMGAMLKPGFAFASLVCGDRVAMLPPATAPLIILGGSALLFGACLGLARRPAAAAAALGSLLAMSVLFRVGVHGNYRHEAIWLALLIALYWIVWNDPAPASESVRKVQGWGVAAFVILVGVQAASGAIDVCRLVAGAPPYSNAAKVAQLVRGRPELDKATILSDADYLLEPLPYYLGNALYLIHEERVGRFMRFAKAYSHPLTLGGLLSKAKALRASGPVLILLTNTTDSLTPGKPVDYSYDWTFEASVEDMTAFAEATQKLAEFRTAVTDETYDVYLVK